MTIYTNHRIFEAIFLGYLKENGVFTFCDNNGVQIDVNDIEFRFGNKDTYFQVGDNNSKHIVTFYLDRVQDITRQRIEYEDIEYFPPLTGEPPANTSQTENTPKIANNIAIVKNVTLFYKVMVLAREYKGGVGESNFESTDILNGMIQGIEAIGCDGEDIYTNVGGSKVLLQDYLNFDKIIFSLITETLDFFKGEDNNKYKIQSNAEMVVQLNFKTKFNKPVKFINDITIQPIQIIN